MRTIDPSLLRLTWLVIEESQSSNLLSLTDTGLVRLLLQRISKRILLSGEEVYLLYDYISSKTTLIRDMAESRSMYCAPSTTRSQVVHPTTRLEYKEPLSLVITG